MLNQFDKFLPHMLVSHFFTFRICSSLPRTTYRRKYHLSLHPHVSVVVAAAAAAVPLTAMIPDRRRWLALDVPS
jgi:hypothetical protein